MSETDNKIVREEASKLFHTIVEDSLVKREGRLLQPIPIVNINGDTEAWFIGVGVNDILAGFFQLDINLNLMRYSSFQRRTSSLEGCPRIDAWTNSGEILERARKYALPNEQLGVPFLTYDNNISRIVWGVRTLIHECSSRIIYVAGDYVYSKQDT